MLPIIEVPETIRTGMAGFRDLFCRDEGFEHICRYVTGLVISPNKTLQGIYDLQVFDGTRPSRRSMHESVFETGWDSDELMRRHRAIVAKGHRGRGREVISVDWTFAHHDRGPKIFGVNKAYDYVQKRTAQFQTVVTGVISNRELIDCLEAVVQKPGQIAEEEAYLRATAKASYEQMQEVQNRILELLHHLKHKLEYKKRTEIALLIVQQIEGEGNFPQANYAFDNGVMSLELTRYIESRGKHWVSEVECSRNIQWEGEWRRVDEVGAELRREHTESFRSVTVACRNGEKREFWVFTKVVRLKRYGRKRLVIVHEKQDLTGTPRYLVTDALYWESGRVIETWSYRWASEIFHEFGKQVSGLESSQVRNEESVIRHIRLSCVSQSLIQRAPARGSKSERYEFSKGEITIGQKCRAIGREVLRCLLELAKRLFGEGKSCEEVLEVLMPT
ncbi:MAG TPA: hypothetical protein VHT73_06555 [Thermodesulfobacteriota bacterium]|nr:hypothetical protein [Thermodesulfobacteriota bacterium]